VLVHPEIGKPRTNNLKESKRMSDQFDRAIIGRMYSRDRFSQVMGMEIVDSGAGRCVVRMKIRDDMLNGFGIAHGGVTFALCDSALAFASNSHGRLSVALEASISYPAPVNTGDTLIATAEEVSLTNKIGVYLITVTNQNNVRVALFRGTVYRTSKQLTA
jgi:acyl-CoA thioesterase